jgi:hypothetical protein
MSASDKSPPAPAPGLSRRQFLRASGALTGGLVIGFHLPGANRAALAQAQLPLPLPPSAMPAAVATTPAPFRQAGLSAQCLHRIARQFCDIMMAARS